MSITAVKTSVRTPARTPIKPLRKEEKEMSLAEFLQKLRATTEWFNWWLDHGRIRGRLIKTGSRASDYCVITAVAYLESGKRFNLGEWNRAGKKIGLTEDTRDLYVNVADRRQPTIRGGAVLKEQLLSAVGLTKKRRRRPPIDKNR